MARSTLDDIMGRPQQKGSPTPSVQPNTADVTGGDGKATPVVTSAPSGSMEGVTMTSGAPSGGTTPTVTEAGKKTTETVVENEQAKAKDATQLLNEYTKEYVRVHPLPERKEPTLQPLTNNYDINSILAKYGKKDVETKKQKKSRQINESIAAAGDALTGIANAIGTLNGGNAMQIDPTQTLSAKQKESYEKMLAKQEADRERYLNLMLKAAQLEDSQNLKKAQMNNNAEAKAEAQHATDTRNWVSARNAAIRQYQLALQQNDTKAQHEALQELKKADQELKRQSIENQKSYQSAMVGVAKQRNSITQSHNKAMEGVAKYRATHPSNGGRTSLSSFDNMRLRGELMGIIDPKVAKRYKQGIVKNIDAELSAAAQTPKGQAILKKYGVK